MLFPSLQISFSCLLLHTKKATLPHHVQESSLGNMCMIDPLRALQLTVIQIQLLLA